jgi:hypothetical protein
MKRYFPEVYTIKRDIKGERQTQLTVDSITAHKVTDVACRTLHTCTPRFKSQTAATPRKLLLVSSLDPLTTMDHALETATHNMDCVWACIWRVHFSLAPWPPLCMRHTLTDPSVEPVRAVVASTKAAHVGSYDSAMYWS